MTDEQRSDRDRDDNHEQTAIMRTTQQPRDQTQPQPPLSGHRPWTATSGRAATSSAATFATDHADIAVPRQSQPIAIVTHAPAAAQALAARARARCPLAQLEGPNGGGGMGAGGHLDSGAALVVLVPPLHRWATDPAEFERLVRALLRGHLRHWTVLLYSSRAKALQHCTNMARSPMRPSDSQSALLPPALLDARRRPLIVHALVTTSAPLHTLETLARPLHLPLIYLGTDRADLAEIYANVTALPHVASRLDELFAIAARIRDKNELHGGGGGAGLGREGASSQNWPYPAMLRGAHTRLQAAYASEALQHWAEHGAQGEAPPLPQLLDCDDDDDSRPNSPDHNARVVRRALAHAPRAEQRSGRHEEEHSSGPGQAALDPRTAQPALRHADRKQMEPASTHPPPPPPPHSASGSVATRAGVASPPAPAAQLQPPFAKLHVDVRAPPATAAARVLVVDDQGRPVDADGRRPQTSLRPAAERATRGVRFVDEATGDTARNTSPRPVSSTQPSSRTARNPEPQQQKQQQNTDSDMGVGVPLQRRPLVPPLPASPLRLSVESKEDSETLAAIQALSERLQGYALPLASGAAVPAAAAAAAGGSAGTLMAVPGDTWQAREAADAAQLARSLAMLDPSLRAQLVAERARQRRSMPVRDLYAAERSKRGAIEAKAAHRAQWARSQAANLHALQETRDKQLLLDRDASEERFVGARAYGRTLVEEDRAALDAEKDRANAERIRAFNDAQSTARERALARVPDAPALSHLQAVFLSPRPRHLVRRFNSTDSKQKQQQQQPDSSPSASRRPLTPSRLAVQHRPSPAEIEAAIRKDYALLDSQRRAAESRTLQLESMLWAQRQRQKELAWQAEQQQRRRREVEAEEDGPPRDPQAERAELRSMLHAAFRDRETERTSRESWPEDGGASVERAAASSGSQASRVDPLESLVPELASVQRERAAAWSARRQAEERLRAEQEAQRQRDAEQSEWEREQREERRAAWRAAHPPLPSHMLPKNVRRVERRNPHEWLDQHAIMVQELEE